jgi:hypothetical protein
MYMHRLVDAVSEGTIGILKNWLSLCSRSNEIGVIIAVRERRREE